MKINTTAKSIRLNDNTTTISTTTGDIDLTNGVEIKVTLIDVPSALKISDLKIKT